jgi:receptor expression-enhancing protein 5/6
VNTKPAAILLGIIGGLLIFIVFGLGAQFFTTLVAILYPSWQSFKALESKGSDDDKTWLTYWCVFGALTLVDEFAGFLL